MLKRWLFIVVIVLFIGSMVSGYLYLRNIKREVNPALNAIPQHAALVFESTKFSAEWLKQSTTSLIFKELKSFEYFQGYDSIFSSLDSTFRKRAELSFLTKQHPVYASLVRSGAKSFDWLYNFNLPAEANEQQLLTEIETTFFSGFTKSTKLFDNVTIHSQKNNNNQIHYCIHKEIVCISTNMLLIEDAIKQMNTQKSILTNRSFNKVYQTKGSGNNGNVFINSNEFFSMFSDVLKPSEKLFNSPKDFAGWASFDLFLKPNLAMLNGFFQANDSSSLFLTRFKNQKPTETEILQFLPANTCFVYALGLTSFKDYNNQFLAELAATNRQFEYEKNLKYLTEQLNKTLVDALLSFTENELGIFTTEPVLTSAKENTIAYFKSTNPDGLAEALLPFSQTIDSVKLGETSQVIYQIQSPQLLASVFGYPFNLITENYFTFYKNYLWVANSSVNVKDVMLKHHQSQTLRHDINFNSFSDNLGSEANVFYYLNLARSNKVFDEFFSAVSSNFMQQNKNFFKQFEAVSFQISKSRRNLYYGNFLFNHNPGYKQETGSLWELQLDDNIVGKPFSFTNHYTNAKEIFVQDASNNIYLISNTGKILWKKNIEQKIESQIFMIDVYRNNKYQLMFASNSKVFLLDRNGENVSGFPIEIQDKITSGFTVLDYDNNRDYRILIPTYSGKILNYGTDGKPVSGWDFTGIKDDEIDQILFFQLSKKDYITAISNSGKVLVLNRRGQERLEITETLPKNTSIKASLWVGGKLNTSFLARPDSLGNVIKVYFNNTKEQNTQTQINPNLPYSYAFANILQGNNPSHFYITTQNGEVNIFDQKFEFSVELNTEAEYLLSPQVFSDQKGRIIIALISPTENRVFLINQMGSLIENYPFAGCTPVAIDDFNLDGNLNLAVGTNNQKLLLYSFK